MDVVGEARLNLVGRRLRGGESAEALALLEGLEPAVPLQYILKGVVHAALGQETDSVSSTALYRVHHQCQYTN